MNVPALRERPRPVRDGAAASCPPPVDNPGSRPVFCGELDPSLWTGDRLGVAAVLHREAGEMHLLHHQVGTVRGGRDQVGVALVGSQCTLLGLQQ